MDFNELQKILAKYGFFGFTVKKVDYKITYTFHSLACYTIELVVDTIKVNHNRLVTRVHADKIDIDDFKELIPTLKNMYEIHKRKLYRNKKG